MAGTIETVMNVKSMKPGVIFRDSVSAINSIDLSEDGKFLLASSDEDNLYIYNVCSGSKEQVYSNKPFGIALSKFTPNKTVLHAASKGKLGFVHLVDPQDPSSQTCLHCHSNPVTSLDVNIYSTFMTTSTDNALRFWDQRTKAAVSSYSFPDNFGTPHVRFDPSGSTAVLAHPLGKNNNRCQLKLLDLRNMNSPFKQWEYYCPGVIGIDTSDDGRIISLSTSSNQLLLIEAFNGTLEKTIKEYENQAGNCVASLSEDAHWVAIGSEQSCTVKVFDVSTGLLHAEFAAHPRTPAKTIWSKHFALLISACNNVIFWVDV